eukprot:m51a1_g2248 hypothetical protein (215) ;mRNA; r:293891-294805
MQGLIMAKQKQQQAARSGAANPLKMSVRSMYLLKEFGKGERLQLPDNCALEFPDATRDGDITSAKYKKFVVHYRPDSGLYAGGTFRFLFDVTAVADYPYKPPQVTMLTRVWHPNITVEGRVCHNYLKTDAAFGEGAGWSPAIQMNGLVNALLTMFDVHTADNHSDSFNADDPLNTEAAQQCKSDWASFESRARQWTREYAKSVSVDDYRMAYRS